MFRGLLGRRLAVTASLLMMAGCGPAPQRSTRITVGTFWSGTAAEALRRELTRAASEMGDVTVSVQTFTMGGMRDYLFDSQVHDRPGELDLIVVPNDWLGRLWRRNQIAGIPLGRANNVEQNLVRQAVVTVTEGDTMLAVPIAAEVVALVYDPSRFPSPPATVEELLNAEGSAGALGVAVDVANPYYLAPLISSLQGSLVDENGHFVWQPGAVLETLERLRPSWDSTDGWAVSHGSDLESLHLQLFEEGRLASFLTGPWVLEALERGPRPFAVTPVPRFAEAPYPARALIGYQSIAVVRSTRWIDLSLALAQRLCEPAINDDLNRYTRRLPVLLESFKSAASLASPGRVGFLRALEDGQSFPVQADWGEAFSRAARRLDPLASMSTPPSRAALRAIVLGSGS